MSAFGGKADEIVGKADIGTRKKCAGVSPWLLCRVLAAPFGVLGDLPLRHKNTALLGGVFILSD